MTYYTKFKTATAYSSFDDFCAHAFSALFEKELMQFGVLFNLK